MQETHNPLRALTTIGVVFLILGGIAYYSCVVKPEVNQQRKISLLWKVKMFLTMNKHSSDDDKINISDRLSKYPQEVMSRLCYTEGEKFAYVLKTDEKTIIVAFLKADDNEELAEIALGIGGKYFFVQKIVKKAIND